MKRTINNLKKRWESYRIVLKRFPMYKLKMILKILKIISKYYRGAFSTEWNMQDGAFSRK